jgi:hypothetical protein
MRRRLPHRLILKFGAVALLIGPGLASVSAEMRIFYDNSPIGNVERFAIPYATQIDTPYNPPLYAHDYFSYTELYGGSQLLSSTRKVFYETPHDIMSLGSAVMMEVSLPRDSNDTGETPAPREPKPLASADDVFINLRVAGRYLNQLYDTICGLDLVVLTSSTVSVAAAYDFFYNGYGAYSAPLSTPSVPNLPSNTDVQFLLPPGRHVLRFEFSGRGFQDQLFGANGPNIVNAAGSGTVALSFVRVGNEDERSDTDGDGFSDIAEVDAETDMDDPADFPGAPAFKIATTSFARHSGTVSMSWSMNRQRRPARVFRTTSLSPPSWSPISNLLYDFTSFTDRFPPSGQAFYRVVAD